MRNLLKSLAVAVIVVGFVSHRSEAQGLGLDIGVTGAVNFATLSGEGDEDLKNLVGFMAGLSLIHQATPMFAIQPEVAYSRKGAKTTFEGDEFELILAYIDVPVLAKIPLGTAMGQARPALYVGPYAAINIGCDGKGLGVTVECTEIDLDAKSFDYGIIGGVGLDFGRVNVFARYQFGIAEIDDSDQPTDAKNRVIQIGGRWSFRALR